jgi:hypothetical protein
VEGPPSPQERRRLAPHLRAQRYDLVVDIPNAAIFVD